MTHQVVGLSGNNLSEHDELPDGWTIEKIGNITNFIGSGITPKGGKEVYLKSGIPFIRSQNVYPNGLHLENIVYISGEMHAQMRRTHIFPRDVLLNITGASIGRSTYIPDIFQSANVNQHVCILRFVPKIFHQFASLFLNSSLGQKQIFDLQGGVTRQGLNYTQIRSIIIPLPPLPEQHRIVAAIDELFKEVDAAHDRLNKVPEILKHFRQAVLAAACSGRLTEDWREKHTDIEFASKLLIKENSKLKKIRRVGRLWGAGIIPDLTEEELESLPLSWIWTTVKEIGDNPDETVQVGPMSMQSKTFTEKGVPVLNVGCVQWGFFDESKLNFMPEDLAQSFYRYKIIKNDILFTRSGTVGRCAIASHKQNGYLMTFHLLRVRSSVKKCLPKYLQFVFWGAPNIKRQTDAGIIGSTRAGFNTHLLANLNIPLPPHEEQHEIVRRVESLFALSDEIERQVVAATKRTDGLRQAILAKAFRGELVPNETELGRSIST